MSLLTDILKEAPLSAVLQEKIKALEVENAELKRQLEDSRRLYQVLQTEHQNFVALHAEEKRIHHGIDFRKGKRTGGQWQPFCPKCGLPANDVVMANGDRWALCSAHCEWTGQLLEKAMIEIIAEIAQ